MHDNDETSWMKCNIVQSAVSNSPPTLHAACNKTVGSRSSLSHSNPYGELSSYTVSPSFTSTLYTPAAFPRWKRLILIQLSVSSTCLRLRVTCAMLHWTMLHYPRSLGWAHGVWVAPASGSIGLQTVRDNFPLRFTWDGWHTALVSAIPADQVAGKVAQVWGLRFQHIESEVEDI